jgi:hypothetical protein
MRTTITVNPQLPAVEVRPQVFRVTVTTGLRGPRGQGLINLDGGTPSTNYGGIQSIDAGGVTN